MPRHKRETFIPVSPRLTYSMVPPLSITLPSPFSAALLNVILRRVWRLEQVLEFCFHFVNHLFHQVNSPLQYFRVECELCSGCRVQLRQRYSRAERKRLAII